MTHTLPPTNEREILYLTVVQVTRFSPLQEKSDTTQAVRSLCMWKSRSMAHGVSPTDLDIQISDTFERFLKAVQEGTKEEVLRLIGTVKRASKSRESQSDPSKQLENALEKNDVVEVWKLIAKANDENEMAETLENLTETCRTIKENENNKEEGCNFKCTLDLKKLCTTLMSSICWIFQCNEEDIEEETEMRSEKEQTWIKILSNPLYIGLEWLWRNNPNSQYKKGKRRKESKFEDVIEAVLDDAYLLEKIASYEHHYSRDEYEHRALEYEKFAADIMEQINTSDLKQLHEIMDIEGNGSLLKKKPDNFNQSISLLKMAADKQRKQVGICGNGSEWDCNTFHVSYSLTVTGGGRNGGVRLYNDDMYLFSEIKSLVSSLYSC